MNMLWIFALIISIVLIPLLFSSFIASKRFKVLRANALFVLFCVFFPFFFHSSPSSQDWTGVLYDFDNDSDTEYDLDGISDDTFTEDQGRPVDEQVRLARRRIKARRRKKELEYLANMGAKMGNQDSATPVPPYLQVPQQGPPPQQPQALQPLGGPHFSLPVGPNQHDLHRPPAVYFGPPPKIGTVEPQPVKPPSPPGDRRALIAPPANPRPTGDSGSNSGNNNTNNDNTNRSSAVPPIGRGGAFSQVRQSRSSSSGSGGGDGNTTGNRGSRRRSSGSSNSPKRRSSGSQQR